MRSTHETGHGPKPKYETQRMDSGLPLNQIHCFGTHVLGEHEKRLKFRAEQTARVHDRATHVVTPRQSSQMETNWMEKDSQTHSGLYKNKSNVHGKVQITQCILCGPVYRTNSVTKHLAHHCLRFTAEQILLGNQVKSALRCRLWLMSACYINANKSPHCAVIWQLDIIIREE